MNKKKIFIIGAAIALALTIPTIEKTSFAAKDDALFDDPVIAKGKGFEIKRSQLDDAFIAFNANAAAIGEKIPEDKREDLEAELLNELILTKILLQRATPPDKAKANTSSAEMIAKVKARSSSDEIFKMKLKALSLTPETFATQVQEQELRKEVLRREVASKVEISDAEIKKFYDDNPKEFERPERLRASHILLSTINKETKAPYSSETRKEKLELARKLKTRADSGEDFAKLAKEFSEDPGSKDKGGEYTFGRDEMVKPFETAAFALKVDQISDVVESQFGYHIIKLHEKIPAKKENLSDATPRIKEFFLSKELPKLLPGYYDKLKKEAGVEVLDKKLSVAVANQPRFTEEVGKK